jgi:hypothetical protein
MRFAPGTATHQDRTKAIRSISYLLSVVLHRCHFMDDQFLQQFGEISPTRTEADAVHQQTLLGIEPVVLDPGRFYAIRTTDGFKTIDLTTEETLRAVGWNRERPVSRYAFHNIQSFVSYANGIFTAAVDDDPNAYNPRRDHAICIADETALTIRLIFDAQPYEWGDVYADLTLQTSPEAQRWIASSGKYVAQQDFAEFCELNLESFVSPPAATVLEIAQTFQAKTTVDFSSAMRLSNGSIKLKREEKIEATAGERADILIPEELRLALPLFKYDKTYEVRARLRYRIQEGAVRLSLLLVDPEMAFEHAFREVANQVASALEMPVFWGKV